MIDKEIYIELFRKFSQTEHKIPCSTCFGEFCEQALNLPSCSLNCHPCNTLFPKLRFFEPHEFDFQPCYCMCDFTSGLGTKIRNTKNNFKQAVKKSWCYINGEWG